MSVKESPEDVWNAKKWYQDTEKVEELYIINKLTFLENADDLSKMWVSIQNHSCAEDLEDGLWVENFVSAVIEASNFPSYYYKSAVDKKDIAKKVKKLSTELIKVYKSNELDANILLHNERLISVEAETVRGGLYIYEDLHKVEQSMVGTSEMIDTIKDDEIILFTELIRIFSERSIQRVDAAIKSRGKACDKAEAIRFIRSLSAHNSIAYETPLNEVIACAVNAIYGTTYSASEVINNIKR